MRSGLFQRIFGAFLAAMLATVLIFTGVMATVLQQERQVAYENEVRLQAQEIAEYMTNLNQLSSLRDNATMQYIVRRKIADIHDKYNADIWIVSYNSGLVQILDSSWNTSESLFSDSVMAQLALIQSGAEVRVKGLFPELGEQIVTIGVPWRYTDSQVVGGVLLHISTDQLQVRLIDLLPQILPVALLSLGLGALLSVFLARSQIRPIREIDSAVRDFSKGDLTRRVELHCGGELEDSRRNFVAAVSHELRSPMTCMRGYVEAMLDGTIPPEQLPKYLHVVLDETNRLSALVHDLLDLSRLESGRIPLQIAPFDANETIRRILITFEPRIDKKNVDVDVRFDGEHQWVSGDVSRINQVISNFVDNALKFMNEGGTLTLGTHREGKAVRFFVQNDGPAIAEKDLPHIFERFYTADKAHTSGSGTGLGLSICSLILREHHSEIRVRSVPGDTCFEFDLPAVEAPLPRAVPELPGKSEEDS